jgi:succinate dehydrogenase/fumarate reductase flavoprotein subunit
VSVTHDHRQHTLRAMRGVIVATGGFNRNARLRQQRLGALAPYSPTAPGNTGGGIELATAQGGRMGEDGYEPVLWAPVSVRTRADGTTAVFPHFIMDRGKPGTMVVNQAGHRFLNETVSYHQFGHAMRVANAQSPSIPSYLIADRSALQKYGLGMVRPGTRDVSAFVAEGYLFEGKTLDELATKLGMPLQALRQSAEEIACYAADGVDHAFGRGSTAYLRNIGDPTVAPNPTLGRLDNPPFYAVRIFPGDIGAASGLVTDANANVLNHADEPIHRLYAVGNDMHSVMGGTYPGPGITLGPAIAFAYAAVEHALATTTPTAIEARHVAAD